MVSGWCINTVVTKHNEKVQKKKGHFFSCNDRNKCNKGSFNDNTGYVRVQHYVTSVMMDSCGCINCCIEM